MHPHQLLISLIAPTAALSLPSTIAPRAAAQTCGLYKYAQSPNNPPACWAWYASTSPASDYCGGSSFNTISTSTSSSSSWLDSCTSLRTTEQSAPRDFFLANYATNAFNTLLTSGSCAFQVQPATPPSSDQVYVGGTDVVDILGSAITASRAAGGKVGIEGSMTCSPGVVRWRIVPV
ncbi:uncharacterized protein F4822DRAFT_271217 [Hypoxylon trugodes]|uniref:uncharacterized protein n=1 Tax=Hypoxylon trugodes TaxID=326681 RepID=UPI00219ED32B|nr:uncharacterized protein F4822DRAFT_271217 [Hypoxylon trugodes]KAI1389161.1 hypothetical protein F4822DRAFT_271217 [Hypoxylon trugodes]